MKYTAGQAAKATGLSTATITRALKSGKISGSKDANGAWSIDPSELHRVFAPLTQKGPTSHAMQEHATPPETHEKPYEVRSLEREIQLLRESLDDLKGDRDRWRDMAERLSLSPPTDNSPHPKTTFWKSLFRR